MNKDNGMLWSCMCSLIEILWVLKEKMSLNCWQLQHDVPVTDIVGFNVHLNFLYFLWNLVNLLVIFTTCEKLRAYDKKSKCLKQLFDALDDQKFIFNDRAEIFFLNFSVANMPGNAMQWELQTMIECIFHPIWSMTRFDLKACEVSNHHLKLQSKKFSSFQTHVPIFLHKVKRTPYFMRVTVMGHLHYHNSDFTTIFLSYSSLCGTKTTSANLRGN